MILIITVLLHLILLVNTRFTLWPEMTVYPYLLNHGFLLYRDIINPYPPFFIWFLTIFSKAFGYQPLGYQLLTWLLVILIDISVFIIARNIFKKKSYANLAIIFFAFISVPFLINGLWFDLAQTPPVLFAFYFFQRYLSGKKSKDLFIVSVLLSITFFIKQQIIWMGIFFALVLFWKYRSNSIKIFAKNYYIFLPFLFMLTLASAFFWLNETIGDFLFWVFYFPFIKASQMPGYILLPSAKQIILLAGLSLFFIPIIFRGSKQSKLAILSGLTLFLFAYPRFDYFHLIPSLSLLSLTVGENIKLLTKSNFRIRLAFLLGAVVLTVQTARYIHKNWMQEVRFFEKDIIETSNFIKNFSASYEPIFIQNGPDQILPLSGRLPTKPWADDFPWYLELENSQEKVLKGLIAESPKYIISKPYDNVGKFELGSYRPSKIAAFVDENYRETTQISDTLWLKEKYEK
ncbi:MAG: glycosyltransferase family 39 protein [Candidatus Curtissbacteria bacterium]|nr:glycosyltransferase family 39 protein [Candidatus Curtissbacteria bacterium]